MNENMRYTGGPGEPFTEAIRAVLAGADPDAVLRGLTAHAAPQEDAVITAAHALGTAHGTAAGSWVIGGNTSAATMRALLRAEAEGDPEFWDSYRVPLSGEYADDPTPAAVLAELGLSEDDERVDEALTAYEDAHSTAWGAEVVRAATAMLPD